MTVIYQSAIISKNKTNLSIDAALGMNNSIFIRYCSQMSDNSKLLTPTYGFEGQNECDVDDQNDLNYF